MRVVPVKCHDMHTAVYTTLPLGSRVKLWDLYSRTFADVNRRAAQRHLMFLGEFHEVMADPRVAKYVVWDDRRPVAFATITNELDAWPLISPPFFERLWPKQYANRHIWYVGFVLVARDDPRPPADTFANLIAAMSPPVIAAQGVSVMDYCGFNVDTVHLPMTAHQILSAHNPLTVSELVDRQEFWSHWPAGHPNEEGIEP